MGKKDRRAPPRKVGPRPPPFVSLYRPPHQTSPTPPLPQELASTVQALVGEDPPAKADAVVGEVRARKAEWELEDLDVAKVGRLVFNSISCPCTVCCVPGRRAGGGQQRQERQSPLGAPLQCAGVPYIRGHP